MSSALRSIQPRLAAANVMEALLIQGESLVSPDSPFMIEARNSLKPADPRLDVEEQLNGFINAGYIDRETQLKAYQAVVEQLSEQLRRFPMLGASASAREAVEAALERTSVIQRLAEPLPPSSQPTADSRDHSASFPAPRRLLDSAVVTAFIPALSAFGQQCVTNPALCDMRASFLKALESGWIKVFQDAPAGALRFPDGSSLDSQSKLWAPELDQAVAGLHAILGNLLVEPSLNATEREQVLSSLLAWPWVRASLGSLLDLIRILMSPQAKVIKVQATARLSQSLARLSTALREKVDSKGESGFARELKRAVDESVARLPSEDGTVQLSLSALADDLLALVASHSVELLAQSPNAAPLTAPWSLECHPTALESLVSFASELSAKAYESEDEKSAEIREQQSRSLWLVLELLWAHVQAIFQPSKAVTAEQLARLLSSSVAAKLRTFLVDLLIIDVTTTSPSVRAIVDRTQELSRSILSTALELVCPAADLPAFFNQVVSTVTAGAASTDKQQKEKIAFLPVLLRKVREPLVASQIASQVMTSFDSAASLRSEDLKTSFADETDEEEFWYGTIGATSERKQAIDTAFAPLAGLLLLVEGETDFSTPVESAAEDAKESKEVKASDDGASLPVQALDTIQACLYAELLRKVAALAPSPAGSAGSPEPEEAQVAPTPAAAAATAAAQAVSSNPTPASRARNALRLFSRYALAVVQSSFRTLKLARAAVANPNASAVDLARIAVTAVPNSPLGAPLRTTIALAESLLKNTDAPSFGLASLLLQSDRLPKLRLEYAQFVEELRTATVRLGLVSVSSPTTVAVTIASGSSENHNDAISFPSSLKELNYNITLLGDGLKSGSKIMIWEQSRGSSPNQFVLEGHSTDPLASWRNYHGGSTGRISNPSRLRWSANFRSGGSMNEGIRVEYKAGNQKELLPPFVALANQLSMACAAAAARAVISDDSTANDPSELALLGVTSLPEGARVLSFCAGGARDWPESVRAGLSQVGWKQAAIGAEESAATDLLRSLIERPVTEFGQTAPALPLLTQQLIDRMTVSGPKMMAMGRTMIPYAQWGTEAVFAVLAHHMDYGVDALRLARAPVGAPEAAPDRAVAALWSLATQVRRAVAESKMRDGPDGLMRFVSTLRERAIFSIGLRPAATAEFDEDTAIFSWIRASSATGASAAATVTVEESKGPVADPSEELPSGVPPLIRRKSSGWVKLRHAAHLVLPALRSVLRIKHFIQAQKEGRGMQQSRANFQSQLAQSMLAFLWDSPTLPAVPSTFILERGLKLQTQKAFVRWNALRWVKQELLADVSAAALNGWSEKDLNGALALWANRVSSAGNHVVAGLLAVGGGLSAALRLEFSRIITSLVASPSSDNGFSKRLLGLSLLSTAPQANDLQLLQPLIPVIASCALGVVQASSAVVPSVSEQAASWLALKMLLYSSAKHEVSVSAHERIVDTLFGSFTNVIRPLIAGEAEVKEEKDEKEAKEVPSGELTVAVPAIPAEASVSSPVLFRKRKSDKGRASRVGSGTPVESPSVNGSVELSLPTFFDVLSTSPTVSGGAVLPATSPPQAWTISSASNAWLASLWSARTQDSMLTTLKNRTLSSGERASLSHQLLYTILRAMENQLLWQAKRAQATDSRIAVSSAQFSLLWTIATQTILVDDQPLTALSIMALKTVGILLNAFEPESVVTVGSEKPKALNDLFIETLSSPTLAPVIRGELLTIIRSLLHSSPSWGNWFASMAKPMLASVTNPSTTDEAFDRAILVLDILGGDTARARPGCRITYPDPVTKIDLHGTLVDPATSLVLPDGSDQAVVMSNWKVNPNPIRRDAEAVKSDDEKAVSSSQSLATALYEPVSAALQALISRQTKGLPPSRTLRIAAFVRRGVRVVTSLFGSQLGSMEGPLAPTLLAAAFRQPAQSADRTKPTPKELDWDHVERATADLTDDVRMVLAGIPRSARLVQPLEINHWIAFPEFDVGGQDLTQKSELTDKVPQLLAESARMDNCFAFNTNGWMKRASAAHRALSGNLDAWASGKNLPYTPPGLYVRVRVRGPEDVFNYHVWVRRDFASTTYSLVYTMKDASNVGKLADYAASRPDIAAFDAAGNFFVADPKGTAEFSKFIFERSLVPKVETPATATGASARTWVFYPGWDFPGNDLGNESSMVSASAFTLLTAATARGPDCWSVNTQAWFKNSTLRDSNPSRYSRWSSSYGNRSGIWVRVELAPGAKPNPAPVEDEFVMYTAYKLTDYPVDTFTKKTDRIAYSASLPTQAIATVRTDHPDVVAFDSNGNLYTSIPATVRFEPYPFVVPTEWERLLFVRSIVRSPEARVVRTALIEETKVALSPDALAGSSLSTALGHLSPALTAEGWKTSATGLLEKSPAASAVEVCLDLLTAPVAAAAPSAAAIESKAPAAAATGEVEPTPLPAEWAQQRSLAVSSVSTLFEDAKSASSSSSDDLKRRMDQYRDQITRGEETSAASTDVKLSPEALKALTQDYLDFPSSNWGGNDTRRIFRRLADAENLLTANAARAFLDSLVSSTPPMSLLTVRVPVPSTATYGSSMPAFSLLVRYALLQHWRANAGPFDIRNSGAALRSIVISLLKGDKEEKEATSSGGKKVAVEERAGLGSVPDDTAVSAPVEPELPPVPSARTELAKLLAADLLVACASSAVAPESAPTSTDAISLFSYEPYVVSWYLELLVQLTNKLGDDAVLDALLPTPVVDALFATWSQGPRVRSDKHLNALCALLKHRPSLRDRVSGKAVVSLLATVNCQQLLMRNLTIKYEPRAASRNAKKPVRCAFCGSATAPLSTLWSDTYTCEPCEGPRVSQTGFPTAMRAARAVRAVRQGAKLRKELPPALINRLEYISDAAAFCEDIIRHFGMPDHRPTLPEPLAHDMMTYHEVLRQALDTFTSSHKDSTWGASRTEPVHKLAALFPTLALDQTLVKHFHGSARDISSFALKPEQTGTDWKLSTEAVRARLAVLAAFPTSFLPSLLPFMTDSDVGDESLSRSILRLRGLVLRFAKQESIDSWLRIGQSSDSHSISIDRMASQVLKARNGTDPEYRRTMFGQIARICWEKKPTFRLGEHSRVFSVDLKGENAGDAGGPFREVMDGAVSELQTPQLDLFIPSPNQRAKVGTNQECWVPNPAAPERLRSRAYEFLGQLMGYAIRSKAILLPLTLAPMFWKLLVGEPCDIADVQGHDHLAFRVCDLLPALKSSAGVVSEVAELRFTAIGSDGVERPLVPGGERVTVTAANADEYASLLVRHRIHEFDQSISAIRRGLCSVVPEQLLQLISGSDLEVMVCGSPTVDVAVLRQIARYEGHSASDRHIQFFWKVFAERFTDADRAQFLRFVWGRSRLPPGDVSAVRRAMGDRQFTIASHPASSRPNVDRSLPNSHSCFFTLDLPRYTTEDAVYDRLHYAIWNCVSTDTDGSGRVPSSSSLDDL